MARSTLPATATPPTFTAAEQRITGGVDTHLDVHVAAALDRIGGLMGTASFPTTPTGYEQLVDWLLAFGTVVGVGVEGTSSYGAGLTRALQARGLLVLEVDRPKRQDRRRVGKSDTLDAVAAARAALSGEARGLPKTKAGNIEGIRVLGVARASSVKARTQAMNQLRGLISTAPAGLREKLRALSIKQIVVVCAALRPGDDSSVETVTKVALRTLARRVQHLDSEVADLDHRRLLRVEQAAPQLLEVNGVGLQTAAALLVTAGDNPERLRNEATFARLCGVAPIPTGSGKTNGYHRLHRGGDRQANSALWTIVLSRMDTDPATRAYVERRRTEGKQTRFIMRCLKRHVAREIYKLLPRPKPVLTT